MSNFFQYVLGYLVAVIGIWHPYVVSVSPKIAASVAALLGFVGGLILAWD